MNIKEKNLFNPNPITKIIVVILLGITVMHTLYDRASLFLCIVIAVFFAINGLVKDGIKGVIIYLVMDLLLKLDILKNLPMIVKLMMIFVVTIKMMYLPLFSGKFLIKTSDVGSIISSMDYLKIPNSISIPIAVMFRFFPSFSQESHSVKMAMKVRDIKINNPLTYLEYVSVPLLVISSNIADDIAKAAQVKCIENPVKKTRYAKIGLKAVDFIYIALVIGIIIWGGL